MSGIGKQMRQQLAAAGIVLDEPKPAPSTASARSQLPAVDRDEVRRILTEAGARPADLDWLTASCPSLEDARAFQPPTRDAWCPVCDGVTLADSAGCVPCQIRVSREGAGR